MKADVIIVGAGVIGTACAYFLSRNDIKVRMLECSHLASGASGASAAMITFGDTPELLRSFNIESHGLILEREPDFDQPLEIMRTGTLYVALNDNEVPQIQSFFEISRQMGLNGELLNGAEARRVEPMLGPLTTAAFYNRDGYHLNPFRLSEGFLNAALDRGSRIDYGVRVLDIKVKDDRIERVITDKGDYAAEWVVVAAGAWTPQVLNSIDAHIPIVPARGQVIITEACSPMLRHVVICCGHFYAKQVASGNLYLGSQRELVGFENRITLEMLMTYMNFLGRAIPEIRRLRGLRFFAGFRPVSDDNLPIIGPVPECSKLIIASGHGATGVRYSASTGKAVSELIIDGKTEQAIGALRVDRFSRPDK